MLTTVAFITVRDPDLEHWLANGLLAAVLLAIGAVLVIRLVRLIEHRYSDGLNRKLSSAAADSDLDTNVAERLKRSLVVGQAASWVAVVLVYVIAAMLALMALGVPLATLIAPATGLSVALGFGAQQAVGDILAGFFLLAERQFGYGDLIRFSKPGDPAGVSGVVEEMTLRVTKLRNIDGELVIIPNSLLGQVTNMSKEWSQAVLDLPIAAGEDLAKATEVMTEASGSLASDDRWSPLLLGDPEVVGVQNVEVGYVTIRVVARTKPGRQYEILRELRLRCTTALNAAGVATPSYAHIPSESR